MVIDKAGKRQPMVDRTGKFFLLEDLDPDFVASNVDADAYREYAGRFVKNAYDPKLTDADETLDISICMMLKQQGKVFKIEKHVHNYPTAGVPTNRCSTIRSTRGSSRPRR